MIRVSLPFRFDEKKIKYKFKQARLKYTSSKSSTLNVVIFKHRGFELNARVENTCVFCTYHLRKDDLD